MADESPTFLDDLLIEQYRALLEVSESIAAHRDLNDLFRELAKRLPRVVDVNFVGVCLHNPDKNVMRLHTCQANVPADIVGGHEEAVDRTPAGLVWQTQTPLFIPDLAKEQRWPDTLRRMQEDGVQSFCFVPLTTAVRRLGAIGFGSIKTQAYSQRDLEFLQQVAKQVAVAVDNALNYQTAESAQHELTHERDRLRLLLEVNNAVVSHLEFRSVFVAATTCLRQVLPNDYASLALHEPEQDQLRLYALDFPGGKGLVQEGMIGPVNGTPAGVTLRSGESRLFNETELHAFSSPFVKLLLAEGIKSICSVPLRSHNRLLGTLNVASLRADAFTRDDADLLSQVATQIAIAVENAHAYQEIAQLKDRLDKEKLYLEGEIQSEYNFEEIVGDSAALRQVLKQVEIVAPTDSSVLILGETGTGKELLARAIHNHSGRRGRTFIKMNCAAIPTGLLESELFGHEKGAFTGAIAQRVGRFELADKGTLFLDEVGDIPLELQSKLLRVLQEQEFERLGGTRTIRVNVRLVTATNQDLNQMVADKRFRSDLYYRLNVFPLTVPPLRDRPEDVPVLTRYFAQKFARRMNRQIETIPTEALTALSRYHWPGNIRELENLIERAVILSQGSELRVPLGELKSSAVDTGPAMSTLEAAEREHILRALRAARWVVGGPSGAAAKLGMKRTTLQSKMQKLGIFRDNE